MSKPTFDLTAEERQVLAADLGLKSDAMLRHFQTGRRKGSAETAIRIEKAARKRCLSVPRESICEACRGCEYLKAAKK